VSFKQAVSQNVLGTAVDDLQEVKEAATATAITRIASSLIFIGLMFQQK
jgi:hypothetical protein